jgi:WD40 repeat protein
MDVKFLADGRLLTVGESGIRIWSLEDGGNQEIRPCSPVGPTKNLAIDGARRKFLLLEEGTFSFYDLETGSSRTVTSHGNRVSAVALDPTGTIVVSGDLDGVLRVGPVTGEEPHLLFGHTLEISSVAVSPDGQWVASGSQDGTIRLWPMPEGPPFHLLPYEEILDRIRALTNLRVVEDDRSENGYRVEVGPFPGWKNMPAW